MMSPSLLSLSGSRFSGSSSGKEELSDESPQPVSPKSNAAALKQTERKAKAAFLAVPETDRKAQAAALSAWRKARKDVAEAENAPAAVQQLDFASLAAGLLA